jgi:hypothetical protein
MSPRRCRIRPVSIVISVLVALACGTVLGVMSVQDLLRYSPYEDPGDGQKGLWLGVAAVIVISVPVLGIAAVIIRALARDYRHMMRNLTPGQRFAVMLGEAAGMAVAHEAWKHRNEQASARLTTSVMGGSGGSGTEE